MKVSIANIKGNKYEHLNVSSVVGYGSVNRHDDVMLIQGFFNYIGKEGANFFAPVIPEITGEFDDKTFSAVLWFQTIFAFRLLTGIHFDGRIHPANYENRQINNPGGRLMGITLLNLLAQYTALRHGKLDYIHEIAKLNSRLKWGIFLSKGLAKASAKA